MPTQSAGWLALFFGAVSIVNLFAVSVALHARLFETRPPASQLSVFYVALAVGVGILSWRLRRWNAYEVGALGWCVFLVFTPGWGAQYTVFVAQSMGSLCTFSFSTSNITTNKKGNGNLHFTVERVPTATKFSLVFRNNLKLAS